MAVLTFVLFISTTVVLFVGVGRAHESHGCISVMPWPILQVLEWLNMPGLWRGQAAYELLPLPWGELWAWLILPVVGILAEWLIAGYCVCALWTLRVLLQTSRETDKP